MLSDKQKEITVAKMPVGRYRCAPVGTHGERAYVEDGGVGSFVERTSYEGKGYQPPFESLPTEDEYNAQKSKGAT